MSFGKSYGSYETTTSYGESRHKHEIEDTKKRTLPPELLEKLQHDFAQADEQLRKELEEARLRYLDKLDGKEDHEVNKPKPTLEAEAISEVENEEGRKEDRSASTPVKKPDMQKKKLSATEKALIENDYAVEKERVCGLFNTSMQVVVKELIDTLVSDHVVFKPHGWTEPEEIEQRVELIRSKDKEPSNKSPKKKASSSMGSDKPVVRVGDLLKQRKQTSIFGLAQEFKGTDNLTALQYEDLYTENAEEFMKYEKKPVTKIEEIKKSDKLDEVEQKEVSLVPAWVNSRVHSASGHIVKFKNDYNSVITSENSILTELKRYSDSLATNIENGFTLQREEKKAQTFYKSLAVIVVATAVQVAALKFTESRDFYRMLSYGFSSLALLSTCLTARQYETQSSFEAKRRANVADNLKKQEPLTTTAHNALRTVICTARQNVDNMISEIPIRVVAEELYATAGRVLRDQESLKFAKTTGMFKIDQSEFTSDFGKL